MTDSSTAGRIGVLTIWLIAAAVLAVSFAWPADGAPRLCVCYMYHFTGIPCPGCGLTRSFCSISHGHFARAMGYNPFGFVFYGLAVAALLWPAATRAFPTVGARVARSRVLLIAPILLVAAMWAYGGARALRVIMGSG